MLPEDEFSLPVYTDVYVTVEGAKDVNTYHEEYDDILDPVKEKLQDVGEIRADERYKEIVDEANEELNKGKEELKEAEENLQAELEKAEKDLEQARKKLEDGERELLANEKKFRAQIEDGERRLKEEEKKLQDAEVEYERNLKLFNEKKSEALKEIEIAEAAIARGEEEIKSRQEQIDRLKESLNFIEDEQEKIRTIQIIQYGNRN